MCLDLVSRPDAFARLWPTILRGHLLDAIEHLDAPTADAATLAGFVRSAGEADLRPGLSVGLGDDLRLTGGGVSGSGLALDGEVLQLSVYAEAST